MKKLLIILSLPLLLLAACQNPYKTINQKQFSIQLPKSLKNYKGQMLDSALLEYADTEKNIFVAVEMDLVPVNYNIDSVRKNFVDFYIKDDAIKNSYKITKLGRNSQMVEAETAQLMDDLSSLQTYWVIGIYPVDSTHYLIVWTYTDRAFKPDNQKTLKKIVKSLKVNRK